MNIPLWLYAVISTIITIILSAVINAAVSYPIYDGKIEQTSLFAWPSTIAGDVVVTTIVNTMITWFLSCQITLGDFSRTKPLHIIIPSKHKDENFLPFYLRRLAQASYRSICNKKNNNNTKNEEATKTQSCWGSTIQNIIFILVVGALVGVCLVPFISIIFTLIIGYVILQDQFTSMKMILIYKGCLGGIMGLILQPLIIYLISTKPPIIPDTSKETEEEEESADVESSSSTPPPAEAGEIGGNHHVQVEQVQVAIANE